MIHPNVPPDRQAQTSRLLLSFLARRILGNTDGPRSTLVFRPRVPSAGELSLRGCCFMPRLGLPVQKEADLPHQIVAAAVGEAGARRTAS